MFHWNRSLLLLFYMLLLLALWLMGLHRVLRVNPRYFTGIPGHLFLPITRANTSLKIYQRWFGSFTLQGIHPRELYTPFLINELKMYWALFDSLGLKLNNTVFFFSDSSEPFETCFFQSHTLWSWVGSFWASTYVCPTGHFNSRERMWNNRTFVNVSLFQIKDIINILFLNYLMFKIQVLLRIYLL